MGCLENHQSHYCIRINTVITFFHAYIASADYNELIVNVVSTSLECEDLVIILIMSDIPNLAHSRLAAPPRHLSIEYKISHGVRYAISVILVFILSSSMMIMSPLVYAYYNLNGKMQSNSLKSAVSNGGYSGAKTTVIDPNDGRPLDVLVIGQDTRSGAGNAAIGGNDPADAENHQSDTMMIAHVSADRKFVDVVSLPRDSIVDVPSCSDDKYTIPARDAVMLNSVFPTAYGISKDDGIAANCLLKTVNSLTGMEISQFVLVDFAGMVKMIDAIGGVDVCIPQDLKDSYTNLTVKRGLQHLDGTTATQYARVRHGSGTDGSDIMRTVRQQHLVKALFNRLKSDAVLSNPSRLFNLATVTLDSVKMSDGLASMTTLAGLAYSMRDMDMSNIHTMTVPTVPYVLDRNRVQWTEGAEVLFSQLKADEVIDSNAVLSTSSDSKDGSSQNPSSNAATTTKPSADDNTSAIKTPTSADTTGASTIDPNTGLRTSSDGKLIDPSTGGIVDRDSGTITNPYNGSIIGFADKYVSYTYCRVK